MYVLLTVDDFQWELLLVGICGYYLDAKKRNFLLVYLVFTVMSLLFNFVEIVGFAPSEDMSSGDQFSSGLKVFVFLSKFAVLGAIYMYENEKKQPGNEEGHAYMPHHDEHNDEEIAE